MFALIGYGLLGVVVAVGVVAVLVIVLPSDQLGAPVRDVVPAGLPAQPEIRAADVARVRLPVTLRGYRMVDTDAVLDRLALELEHRDREIEELRRASGRLAPAVAAPPGATPTRISTGAPISTDARRAAEVPNTAGALDTADALHGVDSSAAGTAPPAGVSTPTGDGARPA